VTLTAVSLATGVLTARFLGPEGRGEYFLGVTVLTLAAQVATLGLHSSNTYLLSHRREALPALVANSFWFALAGGALSALAFGLLVAAGLVPVLGGAAAAVALIGVVPALFTILGSGLLAGLGRFSTLNRCELLARGLPLLAILGLTLVGRPGPLTFLAAVAAGFLAGAGAQVAALLASGGRLLPVERSLFRDALRYGLRVYMASALAFFVLRANVFILGRQRGAAEVGFLSVAAQIADVMTMVPASLALVLFPELVRSGRRWPTTRRTLFLAAALLAVMCLLAGLTAPLLLPLVFGRAFHPSVAVLLWSLPGVFFLGLVSVLSQYLAAVGFPWPLVGFWAGAAGLVLAASTLLVPLFGAVGAAGALSATYAMLLLAVLRLALRESRLEEPSV